MCVNARVANVMTCLQDEVMNLIEKEGVPAPAPIEQRWTASSSANMSPAHDGSSPKTVRVELLSGLMFLSATSVCFRRKSRHSEYGRSHVFPRMSPVCLCRKLFSWVGIIMYLPTDDADARRRVTDAFLAYRDLCKTQLWDRCVGYGSSFVSACVKVKEHDCISKSEGHLPAFCQNRKMEVVKWLKEILLDICEGAET